MSVWDWFCVLWYTHVMEIGVQSEASPQTSELSCAIYHNVYFVIMCGVDNAPMHQVPAERAV